MTANPTANPSGSATNIVWHQASVTRADRAQQRGHRSAILWLTGLSASGKSTIAAAIERRLYTMGVRTAVLDGDNLRHGVNRDLGFSDADRSENVRRVAEVARLGKVVRESGAKAE